MAFIAGISVVFSSTPTFQGCIQNHKAAKEYQELYGEEKSINVLFVRIRLNGGCVEYVFTAEHDAVEALAALVGALFSFVLMLSTVFLWAETKRLAIGAETQSEDMKASITEAARAATEMGKVATALENNNKQIKIVVETNKLIIDQQRSLSQTQMRAYLSIRIGTAIFQDEKRGLRFEAKPIIINSGFTPATKVRWRIAADILPDIHPDFRFPLPKRSTGSNILTPGQDGILSAIVKDFVDDNDVQAIKAGNGRALFVWGVVFYFDVFGKLHRSTFAQRLVWMGAPEKEVVHGIYLNQHNHSN